jgi:hypothetical protein
MIMWSPCKSVIYYTLRFPLHDNREAVFLLAPYVGAPAKGANRGLEITLAMHEERCMGQGGDAGTFLLRYLVHRKTTVEGQYCITLAAKSTISRAE